MIVISSLISARPRELMGIYLNDHLAGAVAGTELARRCLRHNTASPYAATLGDLVTAISEDRATLVRIMRALGVSASSAKQLGALAAERIGRLKLNGRLTSYSPLSRVVELDALSAGINGKRVLWLSLLGVAEHYPALHRDELERLIKRADEQLEAVQRLRETAVKEAFVGS
jgi:hypothetical protein